MKRLGNIFDAMIDREQLASAFHRVCKGKRQRKDVVTFAETLEENLNRLHADLASGHFRFGTYHFFKIYDPKERVIAAASVRDRIVHHAIIATIGNRMERALIDKAYACRRGKGQWTAIAEAKRLMRKHSWCLKLDVKSFFDSIDHAVLFKLLTRKIKDRRVLSLLEQLLESYSVAPGKGLPIGNLTSQYFANLYLDPLDRLINNQSVAHVRYMDDLLIFGEYEELKKLYKIVKVFLKEKLALSLNERGGLHRVERGVNFLGMRVFPTGVFLNKASKTRFRKKVYSLEVAFASNALSERVYQTRMTQLFAFIKHANTEGFRRKVILESEQGSNLSPHARWMLEQQPERRLRSCVSQCLSQQQLQQQHVPEQQQQLLGAACDLPSHSSTMMTQMPLNRSFSSSASLSGQRHAVLCGVSKLNAERYTKLICVRRGSISVNTNFQVGLSQHEITKEEGDLVDFRNFGIDKVFKRPL